MGEGQKRSQAKQFRQTLSKTQDRQAGQGSLFGNAAAAVADAVLCVFTEDAPMLELNAKVHLVDYGGELLEVVSGVRVVGFVKESGTEILRNEYRIAERRGSAIPGIVTDINTDFGEFLVTIHG